MAEKRPCVECKEGKQIPLVEKRERHGEIGRTSLPAH